MAFYSHQSRKSCPNFSLFEEEPVGREPDSILSLEDRGKDYKYKRKSQAEFCIRKMANFLTNQAGILDWSIQIVRKIEIPNAIEFFGSDYPDNNLC